MRKAKRARLKATGWEVGTVAQFLRLTPQETALIRIELARAGRTRECHQKRRVEKKQLAAIVTRGMLND